MRSKGETMFGTKCSHTREDGLPLISYLGLCEECGSRVRQEAAERLRQAFDEKKARVLAAPRRMGACDCPPLKVRVDGRRVAVRVPKQSPLHQLGCPDWYKIRSMGNTSLEPDERTQFEA